MQKKAIYFLTGSSASGKTTLLKGVVRSIYPKLNAFHFDEIGIPIPNEKEMNERYGGPAQWQSYNVQKWIKRIIKVENSDLVVLDGQARPNVILDAANKAEIITHVTLIDCSHGERKERILKSRAQPELDKLDMYAWASYLRGQADALNLEIIDTTNKRVEESIRNLANSIQTFAKEQKIKIEGCSK